MAGFFSRLTLWGRAPWPVDLEDSWGGGWADGVGEKAVDRRRRSMAGEGEEEELGRGCGRLWVMAGNEVGERIGRG